MKPHLTLPASLLTDSLIYGWRRGRRYLYIGRATSLVLRLASHHVIKRTDMGPTDEIDIWFCDDRIAAHMEKKLIEMFEPEMNEKLNKRGARSQAIKMLRKLGYKK